MRRSKKVLKQNRRQEKEEMEEKRNYGGKSKTNDVTWYAMSPELLRDAASIPFSQAVGTSFQFDGANEYVPGIMTFEVIPMISGLKDPNSPINIASTASYSFVRHANSGSANYNSPDLMIYEMAVAQLYSYINYLQRIYGTMLLYSHANRYLPKVLVEAMHADFEDIQSSLANFRYGINALIHKLASLACPASMTYFRRLAFLFSGIYSEGESVKSQLYMYVPRAFLQYSETAQTTGGSLTLKWLEPASGTLMKASELIAFGDALLTPILGSEDMNIMSGDILKAYGGDILKLAPIDEFYTVIPTTDLTVLEQLQNCDIIVGDVYHGDVVQDQTNLTTGPYLASQFYASGSTQRVLDAVNLQKRVTTSHVLTTILTHPEAGDVIERTRGMVTVFPEDLESSTLTGVQNLVISGSEIIIGCLIHKLAQANNAQVFHQTVRLSAINIYDETLAQSTQDEYERLIEMVRVHCLAENFKFHPKMFYYIRTASDPKRFEYKQMAVDIDNYAVISETEINRMNEAALLSLFTVPSIAKF